MLSFDFLDVFNSLLLILLLLLKPLIQRIFQCRVHSFSYAMAMAQLFTVKQCLEVTIFRIFHHFEEFLLLFLHGVLINIWLSYMALNLVEEFCKSWIIAFIIKISGGEGDIVFVKFICIWFILVFWRLNNFLYDFLRSWWWFTNLKLRIYYMLIYRDNSRIPWNNLWG
jgi:hypothetical protein